MLINIEEDNLYRGLRAISKAIDIMSKSDITRDLTAFYHELNKERINSTEIELQQYDDGKLLIDCLLDPFLNVPGVPADFKLVEDCQLNSVNAL